MYETLDTKAGFLFAFYFRFASPPVPSPVIWFPIPPLTGRGRLIACIHSVASDLMNLNLIAFLLVIMCHLAVGLHKYIFGFVFFSVLL